MQAQNFKVYQEDLMRFWEAMDSVKKESDTTAIFQRIVIDRASWPFQQFINKWNITAKNYTRQLRKYPGYYKTIRNRSIELASSEEKIRLLVQKFRSAYPGMFDADICLAFGNFTTGGNVYVEQDTKLVFIGMEFHSPDSSADLSEFNTTMKQYLSRSNFFKTVIHELVHVQQLTHGPSVLKTYFGDKVIHAVLREGVADFIAKLICPAENAGDVYTYCLTHEAELKQQLKKELWQEDKSFWIYNSDSKQRPADLGYCMGARIAAAYFARFEKNSNIIIEIIEIRDVKKFIKKSGYFD